jgi:hypothetical protein
MRPVITNTISFALNREIENNLGVLGHMRDLRFKTTIMTDVFVWGRPACAMASGAILALGLGAAIIGCAGEAPVNTATQAAATTAAVAVDVEQTLQRLEPTLLADLGRSDPFMPLIAIEDPAKNAPSVATSGGPSDPTANMPNGPDPSVTASLGLLDGIQVSGIISSANARRSMAILQVGDDATQILQVGQSYNPESDPDTRIQVSGISKTTVRLTAYDKSGKALSTRTVPVETLIGYKGKSSGSKSKAGRKTGEKTGQDAANAAKPVESNASNTASNASAPSQSATAQSAPEKAPASIPATN